MSHTKWKHITRKHGYGHDGFKSLAMKDTMNLQKCLSYQILNEKQTFRRTVSERIMQMNKQYFIKTNQNNS